MPEPPASPPRVGIYARISDDKDGQQTATSRQLADCRSMAANRGWETVDVFEDVDLSAYQRRVQRPEFERMLEALRSGYLDGIVVWKLDRLTRQQRDLARVMEACETHKAFVASVTEPIDTRETYGQFVAELLVAQARMESANSSLRQQRKAAEQVKLGLPSIGGTRTFGYNLHRTEIIEEEAILIREAIEQLLAGRSINGICNEWGERGILTPLGLPWQRAPLRRILSSAALSGQREHKGVLTPGVWPQIVSPDTTRRVRAYLQSPGRKTSPGNARRYVLGGFVHCEHCNGIMLSRPRNDGVRRYTCTKMPGRSNCGSMAILAEPLEELALELLVAALDEGALAKAMNGRTKTDDDTLELLRNDEAALEELSNDYYVLRVISREEFMTARAALSARIDGHKSRLAQQAGSNALSSYVGTGESIRERWPNEPLDRKRAILGAVFDHFVISQGVKGRRGFDPKRVTPVWRV